MSVAINPSSTLGFNRPLTQHVRRNLYITNHNAQPVAFKVKTTAPKLYCVRPNSGRVEPGETVDVQVMLQAMKEEPPLNAKCKDKFLIQSTIITPEKETLPLQDIWSTDGADEIHSQKIRVVYLPSEGQTVPEEDETHANMSSLLNVSDSQFNTVRQVHTNGHAVEPIPDFTVDEPAAAAPEQEFHVAPPLTPPAAPQPAPVPAPLPQEEEPVDETPAYVNVSVHPPPPPTPPAAPAPLPIPVPDHNEELFIKLQEAQAEIERLRNLISSMPDPSTAPTTIEPSVAPTSEFRRRHHPRSVLSDDDEVSTLSPETEIGSYVDEDILRNPEGVPLQVVIIIALGVFVTTYLFF